ncbi:DUF4229 domain-containing protein [Actinoplanes rectilineatus]|uniref:DUF4229 domain-containing protein n=1 Tax=Actinoplanes rectilineatus TaxID=113571 RepID=UPI0009FAE288
MSPAFKYTLGRFGLFLAAFVLLWPVPLNPLVKVMVAFVASAALSFLLLRRWRDEMAEQLGSVAAKRTAEKQRLRSALAGDEDAAAAGDRVAAADAVKTTDAVKTADPVKSPEPVQETETVQKPEPDAKAETEPDAKAEPETDAKTEAKTEIEAEAETEIEAEPVKVEAEKGRS